MKTENKEELRFEIAQLIWNDVQKDIAKVDGHFVGPHIFKSVETSIDNIILRCFAIQAILQRNPVRERGGVQESNTGMSAGQKISEPATRGPEQHRDTGPLVQRPNVGRLDRGKIPPYRMGPDVDPY